jgi:hypothetical protein
MRSLDETISESNDGNNEIEFKLSKGYSLILNPEEIPKDFSQTIIKNLKKQILAYINENDVGDGVQLSSIVAFLRQPVVMILPLIQELIQDIFIYKTSRQAYSLY